MICGLALVGSHSKAHARSEHCLDQLKIIAAKVLRFVNEKAIVNAAETRNDRTCVLSLIYRASSANLSVYTVHLESDSAQRFPFLCAVRIACLPDIFQKQNPIRNRMPKKWLNAMSKQKRKPRHQIDILRRRSIHSQQRSAYFLRIFIRVCRKESSSPSEASARLASIVVLPEPAAASNNMLLLPRVTANLLNEIERFFDIGRNDKLASILEKAHSAFDFVVFHVSQSLILSLKDLPRIWLTPSRLFASNSSGSKVL